MPLATMVHTKESKAVNRIMRPAHRYSKRFDPICIFNVGQWAHGQKFFNRVPIAGFTFIVPLRKDDELYSEACMIDDPVIEEYPLSLGSTAKTETWEGMRIAQEVLGQWDGDDLEPGVAAGKSPDGDLRRWGVFISKVAKCEMREDENTGRSYPHVLTPPSKEEIETAQARYMATLHKLVDDANMQFQSLGPQKFYEWCGDAHRFAALKLGLKLPWNQKSAEMQGPAKGACWACSEEIMAGALKCRHCGEFQTDKPESGKKGKSN